MLGTLVFSIVLQGQSELDRVTDALLLAGMESSANCEYRNVTLEMPLVGRGVEPVILGAWVRSDRKVIAWNGLLYEPVAIGDPADLESDVQRSRTGLGLSGGHAEFSDSFRIDGPIAAALLHLNGQASLAETLVKRTPLYGRRDTVHVALTDFERVLCGAALGRYANAQDFEAVIFARRAKRVRDLRAETPHDPEAIRNARSTGRETLTYEAWIDDLNARIASPDVSLEGLASMPKAERIKLLVRAMEDVRPRYVNFIDGEIVGTVSADEMLAAEGDDGIEALLDLLSDTRSTRTVVGVRPGEPRPHITMVSEIARRRLGQVFALNMNDEAQLRHHWSQVKGKPLAEQWLIALEDDSLTLSLWHKAAQNITVVPWLTPTGTGYTGDSSTPAPFVGPQVRWAELKRRHDSRVFEALEKRLFQEWVDGRVVNAWYPFLKAAAIWDVERAVPYLQRAKDELMPAAKQQNEMERVAEIVSALVFAKSPGAWDGYQQMLEKVTGPEAPGIGNTIIDELLAPVWQHPDDPTARRIGKEVFSSAGPLGAGSVFTRPSGFVPMVIFLPEFREALATALDDKSPYGTVRRTSDSSVSLSVPNGSVSFSIQSSTSAYAVGEEFVVRNCDVIALRLAAMMGIEEYHVALSVRERDDAVSEAQLVLRGNDAGWVTSRDYPRPHFPSTVAFFPTRAIWASR
jgi:hypothetical protein